MNILASVVFGTTLLLPTARADEVADVAKLLRAGKLNDALGKTNEYLAKHPADPQMRFMKGVLLTEQNKTEEAIVVFTKLTEDYRDLPEPYNNLAVLYASNGQYEKARIALEKAIHTNPSYLTAYENLGDVYGKMASQAYDKALELGTTGPAPKTKLTLLRSFSSSTGTKLTVPEAPAAAPPAPSATNTAKLILPSAPTGKDVPVHRIPGMAASASVSAPVAAAPAPAKPTPTPAPAPVIAAAKPAPAPVVAAAKPAPAPVVAAAKPAPAPVVAAAKPAPAPVVAAAKPAPAPVVAAVKPAAPTVLAAAPAAKPAPVAKAEPAAKPSQDADRDEVLSQVHGWAKAWTARDVDGYLSYYSSDFDAPKGLSFKAWSQERRARIEGKGRIRVEVNSPQVSFNGNTARVAFRQVYESDRLSANSRKTLVLVKNSGKWKIKQESTGS